MQNEKSKFKIIKRFKRNIPLKNHTTFRIGGRAKYFFAAKNKDDLIEALKFARQKKLPFFILGGGSNILVADKGYDGLVVKIKNQKSKIKNCTFPGGVHETRRRAAYEICAEAGVELKDLVSLATKNNLTGLEWAAGIPGTVGGAMYGNAGAFGKSIADIVKKVEVFDTSDLKFKIYNLKNCKFSYRNSIFKQRKKLIIFKATLQLKKGNKKDIQKKIKKYLNYRKDTQPTSLPSAGSVFKNFKNFSAAELIEKCGLKGKRIGGAQISEKHANFIVNLNKAKSEDVLKLMNLIEKKVKEKFGIELKREISILSKSINRK